MEKADTRAELEDVYLPFRPKRKNRASVARERSLRPLADCLAEEALRPHGTLNPAEEARKYVDPGGEISTPEEAHAGARDILAEHMNEDGDIRRELRELFHNPGVKECLGFPYVALHVADVGIIPDNLLGICNRYRVYIRIDYLASLRRELVDVPHGGGFLL